MYILYWLGTMLEPSLGHARFVALYFTSLVSGSFGALLLSPDVEHRRAPRAPSSA